MAKSESPRKDLAYPKSQVETPKLYLIRYCGGSGGGDCVVVLGATQFVYSIRVPKHLVFNKGLLLTNPDFLGIDIFTDAGVAGFCDHSAGSRVPWYLAFSDNGVLTNDQVKQRGLTLFAAPPFDIEVGAEKLPQPVLPGGGANPNWANRIYVHIAWDSPTYVQARPMQEGMLKVVKHNYDIKL